MNWGVKLPDKAPTFETAVARFQQFLRSNQWPEKIVWIQMQDLLLTGKKLLYARIPPSKSREVAAQETFEQGVKQGRGVLLGALFELRGASFCYVWVPPNDEEAARSLMPAEIKSRIPNDRVPVTLIRNRLLWWWLRVRLRRKQSDKGWFH